MASALKKKPQKLLDERRRNALWGGVRFGGEEPRSEARVGGWGGVKGGAGASPRLRRLAIQQRRLSASRRFKLTTINGIFLLSHSIRLAFSWLLLDCPSEAFSIGLLNNAPPPHPTLHLPPSVAFTSSVPSVSSLHWRQGTMTYFIPRNVHHPPYCFPPPPIIPPHPSHLS